jgi:FAD synthase
MKVHYDLTTLPQFKDAIVTMGAFDGVHKGHQQIIQRMKQLATSEKSHFLCTWRNKAVNEYQRKN